MLRLTVRGANRIKPKLLSCQISLRRRNDKPEPTPQMGIQSALENPLDSTFPENALAVVRLNELGPEGQAIGSQVGLWDVTETVWASPGAAPAATTGLVAERLMMGSLLQEFIHPASDPARKDVKRTDLLSYNRLEGRWNYVSFDTRAPVGLMSASSSGRGDGATIELNFAPFVFVGSGVEVTGQMLRMEQVIRFEDSDHDTKDQYFTMADGDGMKWLAHRCAYTRRH